MALLSRQNLEGDEWQKYVMLLLKRHYGPGGFKEIPDQTQGDCGLEGYASTDQCAYQCYGPEGEPLQPSVRSRKCKDKITRDLDKFVENEHELIAHLGSVKIANWILIVPLLTDKDVLRHGQDKAKLIRDRQPACSHASPSFDVNVITDEYFAVERAAIFGAKAAELCIEVPMPDDAAIADWAVNKPILISSLDTKAAKLPRLSSAVRRKEFRDRMIGHAIKGKNILNELKNDLPDVYHQIIKAKTAGEELLITQTLYNESPAAEFLNQTITGYATDLLKLIPTMSTETAKSLALEAAADWLMRCPLNF